jgi:hypothetical protein
MSTPRNLIDSSDATTEASHTTAETIELNLIDLGDATTETKQLAPVPVYNDNVFGLGMFPSL